MPLTSSARFEMGEKPFFGWIYKMDRQDHHHSPPPSLSSSCSSSSYTYLYTDIESRSNPCLVEVTTVRLNRSNSRVGGMVEGGIGSGEASTTM